MPTSKKHVPVWPYEKAQDRSGKTFAVFDLPDGSDLYIQYDTPAELRAAQYKARATAKGIVRSMFPQAFNGI